MDQDTIVAIADIQQAFGMVPATADANAILEFLLERLRASSTSEDPAQFDTMLQIMDRIAIEIQEVLPNVALLMELNNELLRIQAARMTKAAADIARTGKTNEFGLNPKEQTGEFEVRAKRIKDLAAKKVEQINALTALVLAITHNSGGTQPPVPPVDNGKNGEDDEGMLKRIEKLEADVAGIKTDVAVIKANGATKSDVAELKGVFGELRASTKADIADAKTAIILWVVGAIFIAQLLPSILKMFA